MFETIILLTLLISIVAGVILFLVVKPKSLQCLNVEEFQKIVTPQTPIIIKIYGVSEKNNTPVSYEKIITDGKDGHVSFIFTCLRVLEQANKNNKE